MMDPSRYSILHDTDLFSVCCKLTQYYRQRSDVTKYISSRDNVIDVYMSNTIRESVLSFMDDDEELLYTVLITDKHEYNFDVGTVNNFIVLCVESDIDSLFLRTKDRIFTLYPGALFKFRNYSGNISINTVMERDSKYTLFAFIISTKQ